MPKDSIITDPINNIDSLLTQMSKLTAQLQDKTTVQDLKQKAFTNKEMLKLLRFFLSIFLTAISSSDNLQQCTNDNHHGGFESVQMHIQKYLALSLAHFPSYLFKLIGRLDEIEESQKTQLPIVDELTIADFIKLIHELDERLAAHQLKTNEGCVFVKFSEEYKDFSKLSQEEKIALIRQAAIPTNAAYIFVKNYFLFYVNKEKGVCEHLASSYTSAKEIEAILGGSIAPEISSQPLSQDELIKINQIFRPHHMDVIDQLKENFAEFKRTVLPYLQARKILADINPAISQTFLPPDYPTTQENFGTSLEAVSQELQQLKNNPGALENLKTILGKQEAERIELEKIKEEKAQQVAEKLKKEEAERIAEKLKEEEAQRIALVKIQEEKEAERIALEKLKEEEAERLALEKTKEEEEKNKIAQVQAQFREIKNFLFASTEFKTLQGYGSTHKIKRASIQEYIDALNNTKDLSQLKEEIVKDHRIDGAKYSMHDNTAILGLYKFFHPGKSTTHDLTLKLTAQLEEIVTSKAGESNILEI